MKKNQIREYWQVRFEVVLFKEMQKERKVGFVLLKVSVYEVSKC